MSFGCDKSDYLVPLEWVKEIADARGDPAKSGGSVVLKPGYEKARVMDLTRYFGHREAICSGDYIIYLKKDTAEMALVVERVDGVVAVSEDRLISLSEDVKTKVNSFLTAVIFFDDNEGLRMTYVIDPETLYAVSLPDNFENDLQQPEEMYDNSDLSVSKLRENE